MARQGVFLRINETCVTFLSQTAHALITLQAKSVEKICSKFGVERILTEDSTFQRMNPKNAGNFPVHGNKKGVTAGFKMDFISDLLTGAPIFQGLFSGTEQDKKIGKIMLQFVKKGDLILRDMGYFAHAMFTEIERLRVFWLSRLPANVSVTLLDGSSLEKKLRSRSNTMLDEIVIVGSEELRCRLVAVRADDDLAAKRRRSRRKACKNTPIQQAIIRDDWHILLTNLGENVSSENLFEIYSLRWNIEVRFKAWKQAINMKQIFNTVKSYDHHQALIYAALIFQLITLNVAASLKLGGRVLSLENFSKEIASRLLENTDLAKEIYFKFDPRHIIMGKRKRKALIYQSLTT